MRGEYLVQKCILKRTHGTVDHVWLLLTVREKFWEIKGLQRQQIYLFSYRRI